MDYAMLSSTPRLCHFSPCRTYRYEWRLTWDEMRKPKCFIACNPSKADEEILDPTVRRMIDFAQRWNCGGLVVLNACAYRATNPGIMLASKDPVGPENTTEFLIQIASKCAGNPIAAWGCNPLKVRSSMDGMLNRHHALRTMAIKLDCLRLNQDGTPQHPLYIPAETMPIPFNYKAV